MRKQAIEAVREGRAPHWASLANLGITPSMLAPQMALSQSLPPRLREQYLALAMEFGEEAHNRCDHSDMVRLRQAMARVLGSDGWPGGLDENNRERWQWWEWCTGCLDEGFDYGCALSELQARWAQHPELMKADTVAVRERLANYLGMSQASFISLHRRVRIGQSC